MNLSPAKDAALHGIMGSLDDATLMRLNAALSAARARDDIFAPVSDIARRESIEREARNLVLEPLRPLADKGLIAPKRPLLDGRDLGLVWWVMKRDAPEEVARARSLAQDLGSEDGARPLFNGLCAVAARAVEAADLGASVLAPQRARRLADLLRLSPILRDVQPRLERWSRNLGSDNMAAVRLCYKDALALGEEMPLLFAECLFVYLDAPWQILRLISAMLMDRPSDRYLAGSELASFGERILSDINARIEQVRTFAPGKGADLGVVTAASIRCASLAIAEFEQWLTLIKDGPWGAQVRQQRRRLATTAEAHIRAAEGAVSKTLPLHYERLPGGLAPRLAPYVEGFPDEGALRRAEGLLAFINETRSCASDAGFGFARQKALEAVETYIDRYVDDLVDRMRGGEVDLDWAKAYLEAAADLAGVLSGPKAAQIVRRRAAVV
jgi:hypothetical protein